MSPAYENEARDDHGRWTSGGAGGPGPEQVASMLKAAAHDSVVDSIAEDLTEGQHVHCDPADALDIATKAGETEPPPVNLANLHIDGADHGNLFDYSSTETPRSEMPQVPGDVMGTTAFAEALDREGIEVDLEMVPPTELNATQNELDASKSAEIAHYAEDDDGQRLQSQYLMASKDGDILDGHHRWAAASLYEMSGHPDYEVPVMRADADINTLLGIARRFAPDSMEELGAFKGKMDK